MFTGEFKSKRKVRLGGNASTKSRQETLNESRLQRQERERQRRLESSALIVQKLYRSYRSRLLSLRQIRNTILADLRECIEQRSKSIPSLPSLMSLIRKFNFISRNSSASESSLLEAVLKLLLSSLKLGREHNYYSLLALEPSIFHVQMRALAHECIQHLSANLVQVYLSELDHPSPSLLSLGLTATHLSHHSILRILCIPNIHSMLSPDHLQSIYSEMALYSQSHSQDSLPHIRTSVSDGNSEGDRRYVVQAADALDGIANILQMHENVSFGQLCEMIGELEQVLEIPSPSLGIQSKKDAEEEVADDEEMDIDGEDTQSVRECETAETIFRILTCSSFQALFHQHILTHINDIGQLESLSNTFIPLLQLFPAISSLFVSTSFRNNIPQTLCQTLLLQTDSIPPNVETLTFTLLSSLLDNIHDQQFLQETYLNLTKDIKPLLTHLHSLLNSSLSSEFPSSPLMHSALRLFRILHDRCSRTNCLSLHQWTDFSPSSNHHAWVLHSIPFIIPFERRVKRFYSLVEQDRQTYARKLSLTIRRDHILEDAFDQLRNIGTQIKSRLEIAFVDQFGMKEAGIDGGGLSKEFMVQISAKAFHPDRGLFAETEDNYLYPNPLHSVQDLDALCFLGKLLGKALYENILLEQNFADFFLRKLLGRSNRLDDLSTLDRELYHNLMQLKNYSGDFEELSLNFVLVSQDLGETRSIPLVPGGESLPVTRDNYLRFMYLVADFRLNRQISEQCQAFLQGLSAVVDLEWLLMFDPRELQILISGSSAIDLRDWRESSVYSGGYTEESMVVVWFWEFVESLDEEERSALLRFVTSCSRAPLLGFSTLNPRFAIMKSGNPISALPTSATCVNILKVPEYPTKELLVEKLGYALRSGTGFNLT